MSALIWCPFGSEEEADRVAHALLDEGMVACANRMGAMRALFVWDGEKGEADEFGVLFKTHATLLEKAVARLEELHPYDTPAIMGWRCDAVGSGTADWLRGSGGHE